MGERRWEANAKLHDLGALIRSIELHGFTLTACR